MEHWMEMDTAMAQVITDDILKTLWMGSPNVNCIIYLPVDVAPRYRDKLQSFDPLPPVRKLEASSTKALEQRSGLSLMFICALENWRIRRIGDMVAKRLREREWEVRSVDIFPFPPGDEDKENQKHGPYYSINVQWSIQMPEPVRSYD
jgi:hypothetical protein